MCVLIDAYFCQENKPASCECWCARTVFMRELCVWQEHSVVVDTEWNHVPLCWMTQREWAPLEDGAFSYQTVPSIFFLNSFSARFFNNK